MDSGWCWQAWKWLRRWVCVDDRVVRALEVTTMTLQQADHLFAWMMKTVPIEDHARVMQMIERFIREYPDLTESRTWPEIRVLAERYAEAGS